MRLFSHKSFFINVFFVLPLLISLVSAPIVFAASSPASIDYEKARSSYHSFFKSEKRMQRRDQWLAVIGEFKLIYENHFPSNESYKAIFTIGDLYEQLYFISRKDNDLDKALEAYKKTVIDFMPDHLTDDALYRQGEIFLSRKAYDAALNSFKKVLKVLPQGDVVIKARSRISQIRSLVPKRYAVKQVISKKIKNISHLKDNPTKSIGKKLILEKINYTVGSDSVRFEVHTNEAVTFSQGRLSKPDRVYIDFNETQLADTVTKIIKIQSRFLKGYRLSQFDKKNTRLVFDLNESNNLKIGVWSEGSKLLVELRNEKLPAIKMVSKLKNFEKNKIIVPDKKINSNKEPDKEVVKKTRNSSLVLNNKKAPLIVVDAGHGGKDLGAKGRRGLREKDVNLAIALRLKDILKSRYKYQVILTRNKDVFIPLPGRGKIANDSNADVFISIHANAAPRRGAHGIETYFLGSGHNEEAKATAARENGKLVKSVKDDQTQEILASMISTTKINKSSRLANSIQNHLYQSMSKKYSGIKNLGVKEGPFFVLHDTNMASILVEVGFVTNLKEESRLKKSSYLDMLASSIARGISKFLQDFDPMI